MTGEELLYLLIKSVLTYPTDWKPLIEIYKKLGISVDECCCEDGET